jgi:hypothetical protein
MWCYGKNLVNQYLVFMELRGLQGWMLLFIGARRSGPGGLSTASAQTVRVALEVALVASSFLVWGFNSTNNCSILLMLIQIHDL